MKMSSFGTRFSVVCLPENPRMFMLNMQVFNIEKAPSPEPAARAGKPQAMVWCAVFQGPVIKKL